MKKLLFLAVAALVLLSLGITAQANLITGTFTGRGSGSLNGTSFSDSNFTITTTANTANRRVITDPAGIVYTVNNTSANITIQNLGTYTFLTPTRMFCANINGAVGFSRNQFNNDWDLFDIRDIPELYSWDMLTSIGPLSTETGLIVQWHFSDINTSGGILNVNDDDSVPATFTAVVVPEPSSIIVLASASVGLLGIKRRRG